MTLTHTRLANVESAFRALPDVARVAYVKGRVVADGSYSHVQGLAVGSGHLLFTHSDENRESGRLLIADRASSELTGWYALPPFTSPPDKPFFHHVGGCQLLGDLLVVACETGQWDAPRSVIAFLDVSDPMRPRELAHSRIANGKARAMAAGMTTITTADRETFLVAGYEHGRVGFYEFDTLEGPSRRPTFEVRVAEDEHQAFLLFTDQQNEVFAVGLNSGGGLGQPKATLYRLRRGGTGRPPTLEIVASRVFKTKSGGRLRWGSTVVVPSTDRMVLYCTSRRFDRDDFDDDRSDERGCTLNIFDAAAPKRAKRRGAVTTSGSMRTGRGAGTRRRPARRSGSTTGRHR
jgi:hypothetical protein